MNKKSIVDDGKLRLRVFVGLIVAAALVFGIFRFSHFMSGGVPAEIKALGINSSQQLGSQNTTIHHETITSLHLTPDTARLKFVSAKAGFYHTLLLTQDGAVYAMGGNQHNVVSPEEKPLFEKPTLVSFLDLQKGEVISHIDTARDHNLALTTKGRVFAWGSNYTAQLGDGTNIDRTKPTLVKGLPKMTDIAAGYRHSVAVSEDGKVYGWGGSCSKDTLSQSDQLIAGATSNILSLTGYGSPNQEDLKSHDIGDCTTQASTFIQSNKPKVLAGLDGKAVQISTGYGHVLVLNDKGEVYSGGCNSYQQLGRLKGKDANKNDLEKVKLTAPVRQISAGYRHSAALLEDNSLWLWGYNGFGDALQVGQKGSTVKTPTKFTADYQLNAVEAAHDTTFGVTVEGGVLGWGQDDAKAFWKDRTAKRVKEFGTAQNSRTNLSGSIKHTLIVENKD